VRDFAIAGYDLIDLGYGAEVGIVQDVGAVAAQRGDRSVGAEDRDERTIGQGLSMGRTLA